MKVILVLALAIVTSILPSVYTASGDFYLIQNAYGIPGDLCFEDPDDLCGLTSGDPALVFSGVLGPMESQLAGYGLVILWGGILAIVWFKTENIMLLSITGLMVAATITGINENARGIGLLLVAVSIGILLFQMLRQRISLFS